MIHLPGVIAKYSAQALNPDNLSVFFPNAVFPQVGFGGL
jgi:hypothetical protein